MSGSLVMSVAEREAFLADVHVGVIAIAQEGRGPLAVPIWYGYEPGGDVRVLMNAESRKMVAINAAGRFSLCAQTEQAPYQYVSVEGPVTNVGPYDHDDLLAMASRYLGEAGGKAYASGEINPSSVMVSMTPDRWFSTDYSKR